MIVFSDCDNCIHKRKKEGWLPCCDAFPEGIPIDFDDSKVKELNECNNGIKYEHK
jgi:hypothetical protein